MAENHVAQRIADEEHIDTRCLEDRGGERIVGGEHCERYALGFGARDVLDPHAFGGKQGGRGRRGRGAFLRLRYVRHGIPLVSS